MFYSLILAMSKQFNVISTKGYLISFNIASKTLSISLQ